MIETNIRVVRPGLGLFVTTRTAIVTGSDVTVDLSERACSVMRHRHGLAAVRMPNDPKRLLVAAEVPLRPVHLEQDEWELDVTDAAEPSHRIQLDETIGRSVIPQLLERALEATLARRSDLWTLDSPRIWYEEEPFVQEDDVAGYRRYEIGTILIDGIGIGIAVDVGTAFFTVKDLSYYFDPNAPALEQKRRQELFASLSNRQEQQKGTLLYDNGRSRVKCYFESAPPGMTCNTTGKMRVKGKSYDSLLKYYQAEYTSLDVDEDTLAVRVSFPGIERPQPVAATLVRLRIMNDDVPESLNSADIIGPRQRREILQGFWRRIGSHPLGNVAPGFEEGFWRPREDQIIRLLPPELIFGKGKHLEAPTAPVADAFRANYHRRLEYLEKFGCYSVPLDMTRTIYCALPNSVDADAGQRLATDLANLISKWSTRPVSITVVTYASVSDAVEQLRDLAKDGTAVFVLNDEPVAYYEAAFQLAGWSIKRITQGTLQRHYRYLSHGVRDRNANEMSVTKGKSRWDKFIELNALDLLQILDAVPFCFERAGAYEAQLAIDVGHDRRHFALSLLIAREQSKAPSFRILSHAYDKPDRQTEAINPIMLAEKIKNLFEAATPRRFDPFESLLILRDGALTGREGQGTDDAVSELKARGYLKPDALVDRVDIHKDTLKNIRVWQIDPNGMVCNPLESTLLRLSAKMVLVASTGQASLHQGTADPFLIIGNGSNALEPAKAACLAAHLNWASPSVAQRLPLYLKRTDDELKARSAQEVRRFR